MTGIYKGRNLLQVIYFSCLRIYRPVSVPVAGPAGSRLSGLYGKNFVVHGDTRLFQQGGVSSELRTYRQLILSGGKRRYLHNQLRRIVRHNIAFVHAEKYDKIEL